MWFIDVEVERETSAPPPKKNPGSAPASQIFKGRAYELKDRAYAFCLNKQQAHLLLYLGVIFSKQEKIVTYPKFAKIQRPLHSECIKNTTVEFPFSSNLSLRCRDARHLSFDSHFPLMFFYKQRVVSFYK